MVPEASDEISERSWEAEFVWEGRSVVELGRLASVALVLLELLGLLALLLSVEFGRVGVELVWGLDVRDDAAAPTLMSGSCFLVVSRKLVAGKARNFRALPCRYRPRMLSS